MKYLEHIDYPTFASRMSRTDCSVTKLETVYHVGDTRCWSALINQGTDNVIVTLNVNRYSYGNQYFDVMSSERIISDVHVEDIYDTLELLLNKQLPTIVFSDENV